jgi:Fe-S oxidoreductase
VSERIVWVSERISRRHSLSCSAVSRSNGKSGQLRHDPIGLKVVRHVQLFATCLGDLAFPEAVGDVDTLLRGAGFEVAFPARQVCCGQPAFNAGHRAAARRVARTFAKAFSHETPIVTPSGSCATMASHYLPELLSVEPFEVMGAVRVPRA